MAWPAPHHAHLFSAGIHGRYIISGCRRFPAPTPLERAVFAATGTKGSLADLLQASDFDGGEGGTSMESALHQRDHIGVQDAVLLENYQSEDAFLENLQKRFRANLIYVRELLLSQLDSYIRRSFLFLG